MNSEFMLSQGAGHKLESAVRRNDGTSKDIEYLSTGTNFGAVSLLRTGKAELVDVSRLRIFIPKTELHSSVMVDEKGDYYFWVISNGLTREHWKQYLECRGWKIDIYTHYVLNHASEAPTSSGIRHYVVVRPGTKISNSDRTPKKIHAVAEKYGWLKPHWEVTCLIRDAFSYEELEFMGLDRIIVMHKPINNVHDIPHQLFLGHFNYNREDGFSVTRSNPVEFFSSDSGFAFSARLP